MLFQQKSGKMDKFRADIYDKIILAENFKQRRAKENMARKIVVTGGKGGVGKTTVAVYIAAHLAKKGQRVVVCDADFGLNNVDVLAGVENLVDYDIVDVIEGRCRAKQALIKHPLYGNLYILTSRQATPERYVSPQAMKVVLEGLSAQFDFIFIDSPAGMDDGFHRAVAVADEAIVVTTAQVTALRDADKVVTALKGYHLTEIFLVINRMRGELLLSGECFSPKDIAGLLKLPLIGVLPDEYVLYEGDLREIPAAVRMTANNLLTGKKKLFDVTKRYGGFFGNVRRVLKRRL